MRPERRIKPGMDGGLRAASWSPRRTIIHRLFRPASWKISWRFWHRNGGSDETAAVLVAGVLLKPNRSNTVFTDSYVRNAFNTEYFPNQFTVVPHDGDKVTVAGQELAWHALDSTNFNVKLFRFAYGLNKQTYGVIFWAVTVVNSPREMKNVRLAVGSNSASMWWLNGKEAVNLSGDRRMVMDDCVSKRLTLNKGRNVIRGAVINGPGMSDFCVRFIDENGKPIKDLTMKP